MRRSLALGGAFAAGAAAAWCSPGLAPIFGPAARAIRVPRRLADRGSVALTFDDGPHPEGTPRALELLREAGARASFFLVGEQVERHPALAREIRDAGHTIAVHAQRHRNAMRLTPRAFAEDLDRALDSIAELTGEPAAVHRPPYGIYTPAALAEIRRRGLRPLLWSRWGHDWRGSATAAGIASELTRELGGGEVLLLHDADHYSDPGSWRATLAALPAVLEGVEAAGLRAAAI
jgi:peptidoglycan/xylan/chitin deacetylase (PgdA/CDA1 family)